MLGVVAGCVAATLTTRACDSPLLSGSPLCDESLSREARAKWIASRLNVTEKAILTQNTANGIPRVGLPAYQWWSEALHGVANSPGVHYSKEAPYSTSFPQIVTTGCSYNKTLWKAIGHAISDEARAMSNVGSAGLTFWTPNINIMRDPRWGRSQETPGEDPYTTAVYAAEFVPSLQQGEDPRYIKASSCCKHFYGYDLENWGGVDRHHFNAKISKQDEADTYFPAFHSCVRNANVSGLMCSYNAVNGVPSCANTRIMKDIARDVWGFDGYITSDCGAVQDVSYDHHFDTPNQAVRDTFGAGMDTDCGTYMQRFMPGSIAAGVTPVADVDAALVDLFKMQIRLGVFDKVAGQKYLKYTFAEKVNTPAHQKLALDAALEGTVLLKNDGALPFSKDISSIAVVGPSGNATTLMQANYYGKAPYLISPLDGLSKYGKVSYASGCLNNACADDNGFPEAVNLAKEADVTVMVMGLSQAQESEGHDRTSIAMPGKQNELVQQVAAAAKGPVVVIVFAGASLDLSEMKKNPLVKAVVFMGYPGQSGGEALAKVVFGDFNPSGRLTFTQYPASYVKNLSMFDMSFRPDTQHNPGRTYRFYTGEAVYQFGEGLSYTTFSYALEEAPKKISLEELQEATETANARMAYSFTKDDKVLSQVSVKVTNTGSRGGATVVQLFSKPAAGEGRPLKFLQGFEKVFLEAGASTVVTFPLIYTSFALADTKGHFQAIQDGWTLAVNYNDAVVVPVTIQ